MNLAIDLGNTTTRLYLFNGTRRIGKELIVNITAQLLEEFMDEHLVHYSILSAVDDVEEGIAEVLHAKTDFIMLSGRTPLPIANLYSTPDTLGPDRIANAVAAATLYAGKNVLVIDAGTCIKYDFVNYKNEYLGGSISPGFRMRLDAMHQFTGRLPKLEPMYASGIGVDTKSSMMTGAFSGIVQEMNGFIHDYSKHFDSMVVILTGGDLRYFAEELNFPIFAEPDLTGIGLNEILQFNKVRP
jgi:type III pantothenate kinase